MTWFISRRGSRWIMFRTTRHDLEPGANKVHFSWLWPASTSPRLSTYTMSQKVELSTARESKVSEDLSRSMVSSPPIVLFAEERKGKQARIELMQYLFPAVLMMSLVRGSDGCDSQRPRTRPALTGLFDAYQGVRMTLRVALRSDASPDEYL
jgi:hypothetical protein